MKKYLFGLLVVLIAFPAFAVTELKPADFEAFTKEKSVVEFYSPKCPHCRNMEPVLEQFEKAHPEYRVGRINIEKNEEFARRNGVESWPHFKSYDGGLSLNFKDAKGEMPYEKLERLLTVGESVTEKLLNIQKEITDLEKQGQQILLRMVNLQGQAQALMSINEQQPQKAQ